MQTKENSLGLRLLLTSTSAVAAECATFPIDITKTRLQLQGEGGLPAVAVRRGAIDTALLIAREEGTRGLYRGLSAALLRHTFYSSIRIVVYEQLRDGVKDPNQLGPVSRGLMGATAGIVGQVIASPADLVKIRIQADGRMALLGHPQRYRGTFHGFTEIVRTEGVAGLWRGVGPNVARAALVNLGELASYDEAKQSFLRAGLPDGVAVHSLASIVSGLVCTVVSCPADIVKTRMMNQLSGGQGGGGGERGGGGGGASPMYKNSFDCLRKTVKAEGVLALWKGFFPTWARVGPWQVVFWVAYEQMRSMAGIPSF